VRERLGVGEVVDGDEVEVGDALLLGGAEDLAADAAEAVDADADGHRGGSPLADGRANVSAPRDARRACCGGALRTVPGRRSRS
jgi:hypothetical protein